MQARIADSILGHGFGGKIRGECAVKSEATSSVILSSTLNGISDSRGNFIRITVATGEFPAILKTNKGVLVLFR